MTEPINLLQVFRSKRYFRARLELLSKNAYFEDFQTCTFSVGSGKASGMSSIYCHSLSLSHHAPPIHSRPNPHAVSLTCTVPPPELSPTRPHPHKPPQDPVLTIKKSHPHIEDPTTPAENPTTPADNQPSRGKTNPWTMDHGV